MVGQIEVTLSGPCSAVVNGTKGASPDGVVRATYTDGTGRLRFLASGGNLHFWHVKGCGTLLSNGDLATFSGSYTVRPRQIITSP
jgi:hypothetical protein